MGEKQRIRGLLKVVYKGPAWHGPSLLENLQDVTAEMAAKHPIPGSHSIWEIVAHVSAWEAEAARVLGGKPYVTLEGEDDWPPVKDTSNEAWTAALAVLEAGHQALRTAMKEFPDEDLDQLVPGRDFPWYVLLHGMVHHSLYHSGQIGLLKKCG
jgi:uncharacterized damage-inducible protein DinB